MFLKFLIYVAYKRSLVKGINEINSNFDVSVGVRFLKLFLAKGSCFTPFHSILDMNNSPGLSTTPAFLPSSLIWDSVRCKWMVAPV